MVILRTRKKIIDILMILAWASPFKYTQWLSTGTPLSIFIPVIDSEMISQSVLLIHKASIIPAKSKCVVKIAARIAAAVSFLKWEKWNKKLENLAIKLNFVYSVATTLLLQIEGYRRRLCSSYMIIDTLTLWLHSFGQTEELKFWT